MKQKTEHGRKSLAVGIMLMGALSAVADVHVMKGSAGDVLDLDWLSAENYEDGAPSAGDIVVLPQGVKNYYVTYSDSDHASFDLVSSLRAVMPKPGSQLVITVPDGADCQMGCAFNAIETKDVHGSSVGYVVKRGRGTLRLGSNGEFSMEKGAVHDYYMRFKIEEGKLKFPQGQSGYADVRNTVTEAQVSEGAELWLTDNGTSRFQQLSGAGMVTNTANVVRALQISGDNSGSEFSGVFGGNIQICCSGTIKLTGESSLNTRGAYPYSGGTLGIAKIGITGEASSFGTYGWLMGNYDKMNTIEYLGSGETTDKIIQWYNSNPMVFDAGAYGGIRFNGNFEAGGNAASNRRLVLTGSNEYECVIGSGFYDPTVAGVEYSTYITKKGTGAWHFKDHGNRQNRGVIAVEDGTLRFDSLEEAGRHSSLGYATQLYADEYAAKETPVDYALVLGGGSGTGTFEYRGTNGYWCSSRPFAVKGDGKIVNGCEYPIRHLGFKSYGAEPKTLTLGGFSTATNEIADVTDAGAGAISVVKEGVGTWKLSGDLTFHGKLDVKEGRLIVKKNADQRYTWFKWDLRENSGEGSLMFWIEEFGLYDSEGNRLNTSLAFVTNYTQLAEGQISFATHYGYQFYERVSANGNYWEDLSRLTDDNNLSTFDYGMAVAFHNPVGTKTRAVAADDSTHVPIVMRLPSNVTADAATFDWVNLYGSNASVGNKATCVGKYTLYGSVDGLHWEMLKTEDSAPIANDTWTWVYAGTYHKTGHDTAHTGGCPLPRGRSTRTYSVLDNVASVSVAAGAVLEADGDIEVSGIELDAAGAGELTGFTLAENGTLSIRAAERRSEVEIPVDFEGVNNLGNLANWSLNVNGKSAPLYKVAVAADSITLRRPGMMIICR